MSTICAMLFSVNPLDPHSVANVWHFHESIICKITRIIYLPYLATLALYKTYCCSVSVCVCVYGNNIGYFEPHCAQAKLINIVQGRKPKSAPGTRIRERSQTQCTFLPALEW